MEQMVKMLILRDVAFIIFTDRKLSILNSVKQLQINLFIDVLFCK